MSTPLLTTLHERFGFESFRTGQLDILTSVMSGHDTLAVMPTGQGKSLCYQLPAVMRAGVTVVVSPLISLMKDQVQSLKRLGIAAGALHSGQDVDEKRAVFSELARSPQFLLFLSPERVQKEGFAGWLKTRNVSLIAIDEAHCVSQWGPEFRQDYHKLKLLRELKPGVPILALTATATPTVLGDISRQLGLVKPDRHVYGFYRPNLYPQVETCETDAQKHAFLHEALRRFPEGRVIVYCGTRKQCEEVAAGAASEFSGVGIYHAGLSTEERGRTQAAYEKGELRILAATNAFGMGIDHPDVRLVVHFQMPATVEAYYQEIGRAGRDGRESTCLLLYARKDRALHSFFIRQSGESAHSQSRWRALDAITQFVEGGECRHAGILTYFRDSQRIRQCGHCDTCVPHSPRRVKEPVRALPAARAARVRKRRGEPAAAPEALDSSGLVRAELLKEWRKEYAASLDVPAFMVFSNKTLYDLAGRAPRTLEELKQVYGLGERKIEAFGKLVLERLSGT